MFCQLCILVIFMNSVGFKAERISVQTSVKGYKRAPDPNKDAFSDNFDICMINRWNRRARRVLRTSPTAACNKAHHSRLCYGWREGIRRQGNAQYISCYNTNKLIPEFAAYIVPAGTYVGTEYTRPRPFRKDEGIYAPNPQAVHEDCNSGEKDREFCNRGHLAPSGAFNTKNERDLTFIMTNIAPQWDVFNEGNWRMVEKAVKDYAKTVQHGVYVFTGTAGIAKYWTVSVWPRKPYVAGTGRMTVPKYFWKAVCDPITRESIVFIAENNVGETRTDTVDKGTCASQPMTRSKGVVYCYSMDEVRGIKNRIRNWWHGFSFPDFDPVSCGTNSRGNFLDFYLEFS
ncbi:uncharacterized protein LOC114516229 [Dendronephthya gigantea]|uniref:uncharacterized protein LOC114516229 n=1 Tax=Dendronephthya gigantea TaxID=151771 RepID=UPI00106B93DE|nr:uncharacterized protein LOC114516229 [Dendronephthya gigantea]